MKKYRLTYPFFGNKIYETRSFKRGIKNCYNEFKQLAESGNDLFMVTELVSGTTYQFLTNSKKLTQIGGGRRMENIQKKLKMLEEEMKVAKQHAESTITIPNAQNIPNVQNVQAPQTFPEENQNQVIEVDYSKQVEQQNPQFEAILDKLNSINRRIEQLENKVETKQEEEEIGEEFDQAKATIEKFLFNGIPDATDSEGVQVSYKDVQTEDLTIDDMSSREVYKVNKEKLKMLENIDDKTSRCNIM